MDNTIINVAAELKRPGVPMHRELECNITGLEFLGRTIILKQPLSVAITYAFDGEGIMMDGSLDTVLVENCARCGREFDMPFRHTFHERFIRENITGSGASDDSDAADSYTFSGDRLDLADLLRDAILLNIPISGVCSDDCKGLCPICGVNLNYETCTCGDKADADVDTGLQNNGSESVRNVLSRLLGEFQENE